MTLKIADICKLMLSDATAFNGYMMKLPEQRHREYVYQGILKRWSIIYKVMRDGQTSTFGKTDFAKEVFKQFPHCPQALVPSAGSFGTTEDEIAGAQTYNFEQRQEAQAKLWRHRFEYLLRKRIVPNGFVETNSRSKRAFNMLGLEGDELVAAVHAASFNRSRTFTTSEAAGTSRSWFFWQKRTMAEQVNVQADSDPRLAKIKSELNALHDLQDSFDRGLNCVTGMELPEAKKSSHTVGQQP